LKQAANAIDVPASVCADNRTSDHWSFERNGLPSARLGSIPYAGYHSPEDTLDVVSKKQLKRVARIMIEWLDRRCSRCADSKRRAPLHNRRCMRRAASATDPDTDGYTVNASATWSTVNDVD